MATKQGRFLARTDSADMLIFAEIDLESRELNYSEKLVARYDKEILDLTAGVAVAMWLRAPITIGNLPQVFVNGKLAAWSDQRMSYAGNILTFTPQETIQGAEVVCFYTSGQELAPPPLDPQIVSVDFEIDAPNTEVINAISFTASENNVIVNIDWGDGHSEPAIIGSAAVNVNHIYTNPGIYTVVVTEDYSKMTACRYNTQAIKVVKKINQVKGNGITALSNMFATQTKTIDFASGFKFETPNVTNITNLFSGCGVEYVPTNLFEDCVKTTVATGVFQNSKIREIPGDLLSNLTEITNAGGFAKAATQLMVVGEGLFRNKTLMTLCGQSFYGCTSLTVIGDYMFDGCIALTDVNGQFNGCAQLLEIPANTLRGCVSITTLLNFAPGCKALTSLPNTLFRDCGEVTIISNLFKGNSNILAIPGDLLEGMSKVKDASVAFNGMSSCVYVGPGLLNPIAATVETTNNMFYNGTNKIEGSINDILSVPCPKLTVLTNMFNGCTKLTGSGLEFIALMTAPPTTTTTALRNCTGLVDYASIPAAWK